MNESLISPFATLSHPTAIQTSISAQALFSKFDTTGRYIATARSNGSAHVWDLDTRNSIRWLDGHVKPVTSIGWSRNSRYLLTSSKDWNVVIWDLASPCDPPQRHNTLRFDAPVVSASFHPKNSRIILVLLTTGEALLWDLRKETRSKTMLKEVDDESDDEDMKGEPSSRARSYMTVARFDPSGKHIYIGTSNGMILVFRTRTKTMIARHKISGANVMKGIEFTKSGRRCVTNSSDRTLRQFIVPTYPDIVEDNTNSNNRGGPGEILEHDLEPTHRFNDPINKTAWHAMAFSPDGEWLAGGAADPAAHKIYVWDLSNDGQFSSTLDGGREPLSHLHWHPIKSVISSTTNQGNVLIWHCPNPERWGAFAGGFEEVDENVDYEEREDEFDIEDEVVLQERKMKTEEEDIDVDTFAVATSPSGRLTGGVVGGGTHTHVQANSTDTPSSSSTPGVAPDAAGHKKSKSPPLLLTINSSSTTSKVDANGDVAMDTEEARADVKGEGRAPSAGSGRSIPSTSTSQAGSGTGGHPSSAGLDSDVLWAEEDPDDDIPSKWEMQILMEEYED